MQVPVSRPSAARAVFVEGTIVGGILAAVHLVLSLAHAFAGSSVLSVILLIVIVLAWLGAFFWAGVRGAKKTGRVGMGTLTGLWCAVVAGILAFIINVIILTTLPSSSIDVFTELIRQSLSQSSTRPNISEQSLRAGVIIDLVLGNVCLTIIGIGVGAGIGALGGLLGKSQAPALAANSAAAYSPYGQAPYMQAPYAQAPYYSPSAPYAQDSSSSYGQTPQSAPSQTPQTPQAPQPPQLPQE